MRTRSALALLAVVALAAPAAAADLTGTRLCRFTDTRVTESSGLALSTDSRLLWTHNDSGDAPRFFGVDPVTCRTVATYRLDLPAATVPGLGGPTSVDWEDMTRGTAADGTPVLLLGDIGDNYQARAAAVLVYEVAEPSTAPAPDPVVERPLAVRAVHQLVYPGGPKDAEALTQLPDGRLVVVTKDRGPVSFGLGEPQAGAYTGRSEVYVSAARPTGGPVQMRKTADLDVGRLPGVDPTSQADLPVTGAALSRDGQRLVVRTYTTAYVWPVVGGDLASAVAGVPQVVPLLRTKQGEAVTWTARGDGLLTSTEGSGTVANPEHGAVDAYLPADEDA